MKMCIEEGQFVPNVEIKNASFGANASLYVGKWGCR